MPTILLPCALPELEEHFRPGTSVVDANGQLEILRGNGDLEDLRDLCRKSAPDLVILPYGNDGPPPLDGLLSDLPVVAVVADNDPASLRRAWEDGVAAIVAAPSAADAVSHAIGRALSRNRAEQRARQAEQKLRTLRRELSIAERIQQGILPSAYSDRPDVDVFAQMTPANEMGGDFYDFFAISPGELGLVVADVAGKGVPAAFFMAVARTLVRATAVRGNSPRDCVAEVNNLICDTGISGMLVSVFYGILDINTWKLTYASGGHLPPMLISGSDGSVRALGGGDGVVLGVEKGLPYEEATVELEPNDALFCYTDGVTEAFNTENEQFSEMRLIEALGESDGLSSQAIAVNVFDAIDHFAFNAEQNDDITCLVVKRRSDTCFATA